MRTDVHVYVTAPESELEDKEKGNDAHNPVRLLNRQSCGNGSPANDSEGVGRADDSGHQPELFLGDNIRGDCHQVVRYERHEHLNQAPQPGEHPEAGAEGHQQQSQRDQRRGQQNPRQALAPATHPEPAAVGDISGQQARNHGGRTAEHHHEGEGILFVVGPQLDHLQPQQQLRGAGPGEDGAEEGHAELPIEPLRLALGSGKSLQHQWPFSLNSASISGVMAPSRISACSRRPAGLTCRSTSTTPNFCAIPSDHSQLSTKHQW